MVGPARPTGRPEAAKGGRAVPLGFKLAGATIALISAVTALVCWGLSAYQRESLLHSKESAAVALTRLFADSCAAPIVFGDGRALNDALSTLGRNDDVAYAAVWGLADNGGVGERLADFARGRPAAITSVTSGIELRREADRIVVLAPVSDLDAKLVGAAAVTFSLDHENAAIADVMRRTLWISAALAAGISGLLLAMARVVIVRPLSQLLVAANEIEQGVSTEIEIQSSDEIGQLVSAFRSMSVAIRTREERISARNRDMRLVLDNVSQGFLTLDLNARVSEERSKIVDQWFGAPEAQMLFGHYLARVDPKQGEWFEVAWTSIEDDVLPLEVSLHQLPHMVHQEGRVYELTYQPILQGERLDKLLVVITDVTARVERERAEIAQRDTMGIFRRLMADRAAFEDFFREGNALVESITKSGDEALTLLQRDLHTLKGNCAIYGIESIANYCHELEGQLEEGADRLTSESKQALASLWANIAQVRSQFTSEGSLILEPEEYRAFVEEVRTRATYDVLSARLASWRLEPAAKRLGLVAEQIKLLGARLGKPDIQVRLEPTTLRLPPSKWSSFWAAFAHVLRNAVDHGLETPEERAQAGKSSPPTITLSLLLQSREVVVSLADDGRGIDWSAIAARARSLGLPHETHADLEAALFAQGVSSRSEVTAISGRGVGLSALRQAVEELDGRITVQSERGAGSVFRFHLPATMLVDDAGQYRSAVLPIVQDDHARARAGHG